MAGDVNLQELEPWLVQACQAVGVERDRIDIGMALKLSREVAHRLARPLAPVSTFIVGVALGAHPDADPRELAARIEALLPPQQDGSTDEDSASHPTTGEHP